MRLRVLSEEHARLKNHDRADGESDPKLSISMENPTGSADDQDIKREDGLCSEHHSSQIPTTTTQSSLTNRFHSANLISLSIHHDVLHTQRPRQIPQIPPQAR